MPFIDSEKIELRKFTHMQLNKICNTMSAHEVRFAAQLDGRCPDVQATKGRAKFIKNYGYNRYARHIQRSSKRRERRQARQELAAMALA